LTHTTEEKNQLGTDSFIKYFTGNQHCVSEKNVTPLICYNYDTRETHFDFFGRNVTDKVSNQKLHHCATSDSVCSCTTWQTEKQENRIFSLKRCISALPEFN